MNDNFDTTGTNTGGYEFDDIENSAFSRLARWLAIVAVALLVFGLLGLIGNAAKGAWLNAVDGALMLVVAVFLFMARGAVKQIVDSQGNDIQHTMRALGSLRVYFGIQAVALFAGFILGLVGSFV